jgi:hypothetical protein
MVPRTAVEEAEKPSPKRARVLLLLGLLLLLL